MGAKQRFKTNYPGVFYIESTVPGTNKPEKIYYVMYRKGGKLVEEKAGRQYQDDMTPARAAGLRSARLEGKEQSNTEKRQTELEAKQAEQNRWTITRLWAAYQAGKGTDYPAARSDNSRFEKYIKPVLGDKEPKDLLPLDVDRIRINLLKSKSPQHVKHVLAIIKKICRFGANKRLCPGLSFEIEMPDVDNTKTEDLDHDQLHRLLQAIAKDHNRIVANMMLMALYTGMRRGELLKLKWADIDFGKGFILIREPKGGKSQNIPLNDAARQLLMNHEQTGSEYVFPGRGGKKMADPKKALNRIKAAAGLPDDFRPLHGLRHTYASMLASSGKVDLYTLQKLMTHKSPAMTQRYAHLRDEALRQAADLAGDIISGATNQDYATIVPLPQQVGRRG